MQYFLARSTYEQRRTHSIFDLKDHLTIQVSANRDYDYDNETLNITVSLRIDDEMICSDTEYA